MQNSIFWGVTQQLQRLGLRRDIRTDACPLLHALIMLKARAWGARAQYWAFKEHGLQEVCKAAQLVVVVASAGVIAIVWWLRPEAYDYQAVLGNSLLFFEAQRTGEWRAPSGMSGQGNRLWSAIS